MGKVVFACTPELVPGEVIAPDTPGDTVVCGVSELTSSRGLVALKGVLFGSPWEELGGAVDAGVLVPAEWTHEAVVVASPGARDECGAKELASVPAWVVHAAVACGSCRESVAVCKVELACAPELLTGEAMSRDTAWETVALGVSELTSAKGLGAVEGGLCDSPWEESGVAPEVGAPVPAEWARDAAESVPAGETLTVEAVELCSVPGWVVHEAVASGALGRAVGAGEVVLASTPELDTGEVFTPDTPADVAVSGLPDVVPAPRVVAVERELPDSPWEGSAAVLETGVLVPAEWTQEAVVRVTLGDAGDVGAREPACVPGCGVHEAAVSGS